MIFELGTCLKQSRVGICVILLLLFITGNPELSCLFLISNNLIETFDSIVELDFGEIERFFDASKLSFKSRLEIHKFIDLLVLFINLLRSFIKEFILQHNDILKTLVSIVLIL